MIMLDAAITCNLQLLERLALQQTHHNEPPKKHSWRCIAEALLQPHSACDLEGVPSAVGSSPSVSPWISSIDR